MKVSPFDAADFHRSSIQDPCLEKNVGRRRIFWTTQEVCGEYVMCGRECAIPGLKYVNDETTTPGGRSIDNHDWLLGLILNILNTRARTDARCPAPTAVFGHWSESYRDDGLHIGTRMWNAAEKKYVRVADSVKAIQAAIQSDMTKLIMLGLADNVEVDARYAGRNIVEVTITATKMNARHVLNLSGTFVADTWVWN
jgi:hypothetical protein